MKHALVTGASGFLGRVLCARLAARSVIVSAVHRRVCDGPWRHPDPIDLSRQMLTPDALDGVDTVFHLAGHAHAEDDAKAPELHHSVSVEGTQRLLASLGATVRRIVYASSVKAIREQLGFVPEHTVAESRPAMFDAPESSR